MINGCIQNREALVQLELSGSSQPTQHVEAVIDTGYNGDLTLPGHLIAGLSLAFAGHRRGTLADGSVTVLDMYMATVIWHGRQHDVLVAEAEGSPLIGMSLLEGSRMTMEVIEGGHVTIEELQEP